MLLSSLVLSHAAQAAGSGSDQAAALPVYRIDPVTCAALATMSAASLQKFSLGRAGCASDGTPAAVAAEVAAEQAAMPSTPVATPVAVPRSQHAQQLKLYVDNDTASAEADKTAPIDDAASAAPSVRKPPRPAPRLPARTSALPLSLQRAVQWAPQVDRVARDHHLDPLLLHAIAYIESRHDPLAASRAGARGLMQVMPGTARRFGVMDAGALNDAPTNLEVSARYLNTLQQRFPGDLRLVLAAYNAGEGAVERHGRDVPPYVETQAYVAKVLQEYTRLSRASAQLATGALQ